MNRAVWSCMLGLSSVFAAVDAIAVTQEHDTASAEVTVDLSSTRPISPLLFGHNVEYINAAEGMFDAESAQIRPNLVPLLRDLKVGILRFPGGTLSNFYHWADGIGPQAARKQGCPDWDPKHAPAIPMTFGTDDFFHFVHAIQCPAAVFTVNVPTEREIRDKSWMGTPQEAAAWVAYCNATPDNNTVLGKDAHGTDWGSAGDWAKRRGLNGHPDAFHVQFWELGNEVFTAIKDPSQYAETCRAFSKAMKAVDPSIQIGVIENDLDFAQKSSRWNKTVLKETQGFADFLIAHFYLPGIRGGGDGNLTADDTTRITLVSPDGFRHKLADLRAEISDAGLGPDFGVAITEFACNLRIDTETDARRLALIRSQQAALYVADSLLAFQDAGVAMSNYWALRSWQWSLIDNADGKDVCQAPYFVYKLFADHWQELSCATTVRCGTIELALNPEAKGEKSVHPAMIAGASVNSDRTQTAVMLINRSIDGPTSVTVHFKCMPFDCRRIRANVLAAKPDAVNAADSPTLVQIATLPINASHSAVVCEVPACSIAVLYVEP